MKDPSQSVKRGKAFFKKQARFKPASVWHTKENNAADLKAGAIYKGTFESMLEEKSVPVKAENALVKPMTNINFAILWPRESISLTKITAIQDEDLLHFSPGFNKRYKQTVMDKQDEYDDSFASKGKSTTASSYNFESECPIAANLQKAMTTVDEEGSDLFYSEDYEENYFSLD